MGVTALVQSPRMPSADLRRLLARMNDNSAEEPQRAPRSAERRWPATPVQRQLWVLDQMHRCGSAYAVPFVLELAGAVDDRRLARAVGEVLTSHPALSTRFEAVGTDLVQVRLDGPVLPPAVPVLDVDEATARSMVFRASRRAFDLSRGPLVDVQVLRVGPGRLQVLWVAHHAVTDGRSMEVLAQQLASAYATGRPPIVSSSGWPQYARALAGRRSDSRSERVCAEWVLRLEDADPGRGTVPLDHPRPLRPSFAAGEIRFEIPHELPVAQVASRAGVSEFTVLFAAFQLTVAGLSGSDDVVTGVPMLNRSSPAEQQLVGPMSNTLPVRVRFPHGASRASGRHDLAAALGAVEDAVLDALGGQDVSVPDLARALPGLRTEPGASPLFRQLFNLGNLPGGGDVIEVSPDVTMRLRPVPNQTVRLDLEMTLERTGGATIGRLEYNRRLYDERTARGIVVRYERQLSGLFQAFA